MLSGECKLLVDGEERALGSVGLHPLPAGNQHVFVGAGEGPCVILMTGARSDDEKLFYPFSEFATRLRRERSDGHGQSEGGLRGDRAEPERKA